jgi:hypothetical protein
LVQAGAGPVESFSIAAATAAGGKLGVAEICGAPLTIAAGAVAVAIVGRGACAESTGALVSFRGVNIAVKAVAFLGSGTVTTANTGDCVEPLKVELGALDEGAPGSGAGGAVVATGAIIVANVGRSAALRDSFAGKGATHGVDVEATDKSDPALGSVLSSGATGFFESSSLLESVEPPPSMERIIESAICAGVAAAIVVAAALRRGAC